MTQRITPKVTEVQIKHLFPIEYIYRIYIIY
nr:MAG TPA: hypothetical protein [Caudoviricetes sp.]